MSIAFTTGRILGQAGAFAFEGTRLATTQVAHGVVQGYTERAEVLRARRLALGASVPVVAAPPELPVKQRKVAA